MTVLYRRHKRSCPHRAKGRNFHSCDCPVHSDGKSLGTCDWAAAEKLVKNPVASSRKRRSPVVNTEAYSRPYTAAEVAAIRASCHELKTNAARHKALALVSLMSETGMRISDAAMLRRDAVSASDGTYWVTFEAIKNGAKVCLPLSAETVELLNTLPGSGTVHEQRGASGDSISLTGSYFFHSEASKPARTIFRMGRLLARVFKLSLVEGAHAHRFRKTIATRLAEQGEDIRLIARVLGDTPGVAERHYIFETPAYRERIRQAMKGT